MHIVYKVTDGAQHRFQGYQGKLIFPEIQIQNALMSLHRPPCMYTIARTLQLFYTVLKV